jgi:hypothetical protein
VLPDATKYAMGTLKHSLHRCFFCYHQRTATLEEEVAYMGGVGCGSLRPFILAASIRASFRHASAGVRCVVFRTCGRRQSHGLASLGAKDTASQVHNKLGGLARRLRG